MPARILCVDDDEINLDILEEYLTDADYEVDLVDSGIAALEKLQQTPCPYSTVLLDRMMPEMDGIEVMQQIKSREYLSGLPVIMQTASADAQAVQEGLEAGAYYYLTKPYSEDKLLAIVRTAVSDFQRYSSLLETLHNTNSALQLLQSAVFTFRKPDEVNLLAPLIANATPDPDRVVLGLTELMLNAVEHGNLDITYDQKSQLLANGTWGSEIEERLSMVQYKDRFARVEVLRSDEGVSLTISDEGDGFDWHKYLEFDPARAFDSHGRGVMMAKSISFDELEYQGSGNVVRVFIKGSDQ